MRKNDPEARHSGRLLVRMPRDLHDQLAAQAYEHGFRGCGLLNAAAELPAGDPGRAVVRAHKEEVEGLLAGHLNGLRTSERGVSFHHLHPTPLGQLSNSAGQLADDFLLNECPEFFEIDFRFAK